jgi:L-ascorbate metabolism protein UlaG (beta-lactamase superfamily)
MDRLTYIGHSTVLLRLDGLSILTDPMLRGWL